MLAVHPTRSPWTIRDSYGFISKYTAPSLRRPSWTCTRFDSAGRIYQNLVLPPHGSEVNHRSCSSPQAQRRHYHEYFVTHLPSSSLHPDSRTPTGPHHKLPRSESVPHTTSSGASRPAAAPITSGSSRDMTTVRIPLRSAKHHFGVSVSRGQRPYNEDTFQAGVVDIPAFAKKGPVSLTQGRYPSADGEGKGAEGTGGDPQVFYFGVFDGHGGVECSSWLSEHLHGYIEDSAKSFELKSSLRAQSRRPKTEKPVRKERPVDKSTDSSPRLTDKDAPSEDNSTKPALAEDGPTEQDSNEAKAGDLQQALITKWRDLVGGYFRRFRPEYFSLPTSSQIEEAGASKDKNTAPAAKSGGDEVGIEAVMMYAFLEADLDFISAQIRQQDEDSVQSEKALNDGDVLGEPHKSNSPPQSRNRFKGGSTCSVAMVSTPTPTPFWHPASPCTVLISHVGDTRILLCPTATGTATPVTTNHHPSAHVEARRLRRYAATFVTDSFGEERMGGLANTRSFGDMPSKRIGVSAEPELRRIEVAPAEYAFMVLVSDGISGTLSDQEIVDIVKEARTPDQAARDVVGFATEVTQEGDNATCLVIRFGGWERRSEGGVGAMGTKEVREFGDRRLRIHGVGELDVWLLVGLGSVSIARGQSKRVRYIEFGQ